MRILFTMLVIRESLTGRVSVSFREAPRAELSERAFFVKALLTPGAKITGRVDCVWVLGLHS